MNSRTELIHAVAPLNSVVKITPDSGSASISERLTWRRIFALMILSVGSQNEILA
jgi:hypothetical protein